MKGQEQIEARPRRSLSSLYSVLLLLSSVAITLAVLELLVRALVPGFSGFTADDKRLFTEFDPILGWKNIPGEKGRLVGPGYSCKVNHNSRGLRDVEHYPGRDDARPRVIVLGDSMVWGLGVGDDEIMARQAGRRATMVEFVSMGTSGYGTDQELLWFEREGGIYHPRLVFLILYYANDLRDNISSRRYSRWKPYFVPEQGKLELKGVPVPGNVSWFDENIVNPVMDPLRQYSALFNLAYRRHHVLHEMFRHRRWYKSLFGEPGGRDWLDMYDPEEKTWVAKSLRVTAALVSRLEKDCRRMGAVLEVVLLPHGIEVERGRWEDFLVSCGLKGYGLQKDLARKRLASSLEARGVSVLDPTADMAKAAERGRLYIPGDEHLSPLGHEVIGRIIATRAEAILEPAGRNWEPRGTRFAPSTP